MIRLIDRCANIRWRLITGSLRKKMKIHPRPGSAEKNSEKEEGKPMKGEAILSWLHQDADPQKPLVVMMCGVAGAGKTTLAKQLEAAG